MVQNNYTVAIEISSSKISGAVGFETYEGTQILAATSIPVDGFISRGTVRNVVTASNAITRVINNLEAMLDSRTHIKKAYISLAGLTIHSIPSKITRSFGSYTEMTSDVISSMENDNDDIFQTPDGYSKITSITQEYRLDGKSELKPVGMYANDIEGNYLNIVIKKQYHELLKECFKQAKVEIEDSFIAARMEAEIRLSEDERRNGCAMVDIGAETTTIAIYSNSNLRKLVVLPIGSKNITKDLCSENITFNEAEEIKFIRGYKSAGNEQKPLDNDTVNNIINARYGEILQNVKYQIEESGEQTQHIVFIGGGSKLKNLKLLFEEYLPEFRCEIKPEPQFNLRCAAGVNAADTVSATLYGLLTKGVENCCEVEPEQVPEPTITRQNTGGGLFDNYDEPTPVNIPKVDLEEEKRRAKEEEARKKEEEKKKKEEEKKRKEEEKRKKEEEKKRQKEQKGPGWMGSLFGKLKEGTRSLVDEITNDGDDDYNNDEEITDDTKE